MTLKYVYKVKRIEQIDISYEIEQRKTHMKVRDRL